MSETQIQSVLQQMRALSQSGRVEGAKPVEAVSRTSGSEGQDFASNLKEAIRTVNEVQGEAKDLQNRFEVGDHRVSLPQVMVAMNKSSIAFEATNQVRNRLLSAYKEVMSMQV